MMKCRSVASIWSNTAPSHKVSAVAVLHDPPTLYTAGSDGSIICWNLHHPTMDIEPIAMLCGHAASVVDLGICYPTMDDMTSHRNNDAAVSSSVKCGALISACVEGVLCVWSRNSGHCRRRRKMPPWVGSPLMIQPLPENQRYVCIGCGFTSHVHLNDNQLVDQVGEVDVESHNGRPSKCTVVIVDTYTLTIVQTVFHENLLGPLKAIALVNPTEEREKQLVCIVDIWGKVQYVPVMKNSDGNGENGSSTSINSTHIEIEECVHDLKEKGHLVSFANRGQLIALFYRTCCIFKWLNGNSVGEISFLDDPLFFESKSYVKGGIFLDNDASIQCHHEELDNILEESIAVWNNQGSAMLYRISYSSNTFNSEPMCVIPPLSNQPDAELAFCSVQFNKCLICVSSLCINSAKPSLWEPYITSWLLSKKIHTSGKTCLEYKSVGKRGFFDHILNCDFKEIQGIDFDASTSATDGVCSIASQDSNMGMRNAKIINGKDRNNNREFISSSMILSDNYYIPSAIVYGFHSGDIEVVQFDMSFERVDSHSLMDLCDHKQRLSGHTGAVLCLAAHHITNLKSRFNLILISGGMDCTVRLWDLETSTPVAVMRQHVEPVHQIILPPLYTVYPWSDCFLAVGEDFCVSLTSIDTLRVERMFPGHPYYPARVLWDGARGYMACLCPNRPGASNSSDVLYIWDLKSGARERVLKGSAAHSMYDHLHSGINKAVPSGSPINRNTSASSLLLPVTEEARHLQSGVEFSGKAGSLPNMTSAKTMTEFNVLQPQATTSGSGHYELTTFQYKMQPIRSSCPFPGVAALCFDPTSLMSLCKKNVLFEGDAPKKDKSNLKEVAAGAPNAVTPKAVTNNALVKDIRPEIHESHHMGIGNLNGATDNASEYVDEVLSVEASLLHFSLSLLHLWDLDPELDKLLINEMKLKKPHGLKVASGLLGDRGALTLVFPNLSANLELWKSSSEYCAMRSLAMVSLSQHMISLSHSCSAASSDCTSLLGQFRNSLTGIWLRAIQPPLPPLQSSLAAFYTRKISEKVADVAPPSLQLLVSFWQDEVEHVKMAARSLFHCAASRAIPLPLCSPKAKDHEKFLLDSLDISEGGYSTSKTQIKVESNIEANGQQQRSDVSEKEESELLSWLESYEMQDWISCIGATSQDAMSSHIIVAAALSVWYSSLVKPSLGKLVVHPLIKLVMAMNGTYSSAAADILAEGMENTWKECIGSEIPRLLGDIYFQIECVSTVSTQNPAASPSIRDSLVGVLLPSLALADTFGFLNVIASQIWSTASDSPVHLVSLMTLIRIIRDSPRNVIQYLDKVVTFILQTMDHGNSVLRRTCLQSSLMALKEVVVVFPMVALNSTSTRLAVGDAIGDINNAIIRIFDTHSMTIVKILDASGPPGLPSILGGASGTGRTTAISALAFSPDGEGLVAFSETGLMIRWWSLGSVWWDKLSRNLTAVQCTKLIFVPPWEGFSSNPFRSSIMASVTDSAGEINSEEKKVDSSEIERLKLLVHNIDLSYKLEWDGEKKVKLKHQGHELGIFQL